MIHLERRSAGGQLTLTDGEKVFSGAHNKLMLASSQAVYTLCLPSALDISFSPTSLHNKWLLLLSVI